jgi:hypothetical protein
MAEGLHRAANALSGSRAGALPAPKNDDELWEAVKLYFNVEIPRRKICEHHEAPFTAFADAYFARNTVTVWKASRGFGGKSMLLALLGLCESVFLGAKVNILGGSGEQSERVLNYINGEEMPEAFWNAPDAPKHLIVGGSDSEVADNARGVTKKMIKLTNGGYLKALMASSRSVRGPHPQRLRLDEVDEMDLSIFDSALGQPMKRFGIEEQVVASSTHHYANGTMTEILKRSIEKGWKTYEWCGKFDTPVTMANGCIKRLGDIQVGDVVTSGVGNSQPVSRVFERAYAGDMVTFSVRGLPEDISFTPEHQIPTANGWKSAGDLVVGDRVIEPVLKFEDGGNYDHGWAVGIYVAEGYLERNKSVTLCLHEDEGIEVQQKTVEFSAGSRIHRAGDSKGIVVRYNSNEYATLVKTWVAGNAITKALLRLPLEREFAKGLLDGWLYGDGWTHRAGHIGQSSSEQLARQMFRIASGLGYSVSLVKVTNRPGPSARALGATIGNPAWRVSVKQYRTASQNIPAAAQARDKFQNGANLSQIARDIGVDRSTVRAWLKNTINNPHTNTPYSDGDYIYRRIDSVSVKKFDGKVYDITVDNDHTFLANGIAVSNCFRENLISNGGWLDDEAVTRKKKTVTLSMWDAEYENQEPNPTGRAIDPDKCKAVFKSELGVFNGDEHEYIEIEAPYPGNLPEPFCHRCLHPYMRSDIRSIVCGNCGVDRRVTKRGTYAHGGDWAKKRDWTVIWTFRTDVTPVRLVAFERTGRMPWPVMIGKFEARVKRYGGAACHDMTGIGGVIDDYLTVGSEGVIMQGLPRHELLSHYITAIEHGRMEMPMIKWVYDSHRLASVEDVFRAGDAYHLPDDMSAGALAWKASGLGAVGDIYIPSFDPRTGRVTVSTGKEDA